jgi:hypothetical protein
MMLRVVSQERPDRVGQGLCLPVAHVLFDNRSRYVRHDGKRGNYFFEPTRRSEFLQFPGGQLVSSVH